MKDEPVTKKKYKQRRFLSFRSGARIEILGISIKVVAKIVINFLAKKGLLADIPADSGVVISKITATSISKYLRDLFPQNLTHLKKKRNLSWLMGKKIYLDQYYKNLEYLFKILEDETIPFEEK